MIIQSTTRQFCRSSQQGRRRSCSENLQRLRPIINHESNLWQQHQVHGRHLSTGSGSNNNRINKASDGTGGDGNGVSALRTLLDQKIVGHEDTKHCILLGLAAKEHVFVQGEPGTAKTYAAELAANLAGLQTYSVQFHRDTRLQDLIGDPIIVREMKQQHDDDPTSSSTSRRQPQHQEIVRQSVERGGLLTSDVAVLDDLTRAPGEALNVLLRILNERTFDGQDLPLKCAIATANSPRDDMYVEPLDPANLDRFALQVQSDGLIVSDDWKAVNDVIDMYHQLERDNNTTDGTVSGSSIDSQLEEAAKAVGNINIKSVVIGDDAKECFVLFLQWLSNHSDVTSRNSLLTDRTFLVKAPRILRAQAALEGRSVVEVQDLLALRHMTTFRVPPTVHQQVCELLQLLAKTNPNDQDEDRNNDDDDGKAPGRKKKRNRLAGYLKSVIQQQLDHGGHRVGGPRGSNASSRDSKLNMQENQECEDDESDPASKIKKQQKRDEESTNDGIDHDLLADIGGTSVLHANVSSFRISTTNLKEQTMRPMRRLWGSFQGPQIKLNLHAAAVSGTESVMAVLHGRTRRSRSSSTLRQVSGTTGQPRERGRLQPHDPNFFQDADAADISSWLSSPTSSLPHGLLRQPKKRGGTIALARDISDSMWGPRAALASATAQAAINLARQRGMRFGYCEFASEPKFYHQQPLDQVLDQGTQNEGYDIETRASHFADSVMQWGKGMATQVEILLGFEQSEANSQHPASSGHFFGVNYSFCERRAKQLETDGYTNLQEMLRQLLDRFSVSGLPPHERHLVIITDGAPTSGSATCTDEAMLARNLGVSIHPVFVMDDTQKEIGTTKDCYPNVLKYLAEETNGVRFLAKHEVTVDERAERENNEYAHLVRVKVELA